MHPRRGNPDYRPSVDEVVTLREQLREVGLSVHPTKYSHFAEAYLPLEVESAWYYARVRNLRLVVHSKTEPTSLRLPAELGLNEWPDAQLYITAGWERASSFGPAEVRRPAPSSWFAAGVFANSD